MRVNFKYFAGLIAAIVIGATSCAKENDLSTKNKGKDIPVVEVVELSKKDSLVTVSLSAISGNASQYAYAVVEGKDNPLPKSLDLILGKTIAGSIQSNIINVPENKKVNVSFPSVQNMSYEIFAVVMTTDGLVSEVTRMQIRTPDNWAPTMERFEANSASSVALVFDENIKLGTGAVTVTFIEKFTGTMSAPVTIGADAISVEGQKATISFATQPAGGVIMVSTAEGAFSDESGNLSPEVISKYDEDDKKSTGIVWRVPVVNFEIKNSYFTPKLFEDWTTFTIDITFPSDIYINSKASLASDAVTIFSRSASGSNNLIVPITKIEVTTDKKTLKISLPEELKRESYFDVNIAKGFLSDLQGNVNLEYVASKTTKKYSTGPKLVIGNYTMEVEAKEPYLCKISVVATSSDTPNDFVLSGLFDLDVKFLAAHDLAARKIYITGMDVATPPKNQFGTILGYANAENTMAFGIFGAGNSGMEPIVLNLNDRSEIISVETTAELALFEMPDVTYVGAAEQINSGAKVVYVPSVPAGVTVNKTFKYTPSTYKVRTNRVLKLN